MGVYGKCISDDDSKVINKSLKKFSKREIDSFNDRLRGSFTIVGFRKYQFNNEVDIEFNGDLCARTNSFVDTEWFKSDIYGKKGISKIKVNKLIKRSIFNEVKDHAAYFGINLRYITEIKKINWI
jgi:hypothetical protein